MQLNIILLAITGFLVSIATALPTNSQLGHDVPHSNVTNYNATTINFDHPQTHVPIPVLPRPVHNPTDLATRNDLWTLTLCDQPNHGGICVDQPMQNNYCIGTPILSEDVSLYIPEQTVCQVYNNPNCHVGYEGEMAIYIAKNYDDLRGMQRDRGIDFPWLSWVCHNSIGE